MWQHFADFFRQPYKGAQNMSAFDWASFLGLLLVIMVLWRIILFHIRLEG